MKKLLFGILTFLGIGLSFCSAEYYNGFQYSCYIGTLIPGYYACDDDYLTFNSTLTDGTYRITVSSDFNVSLYGNSVPSSYHFEMVNGGTYDFSCSNAFQCQGFNFFYFHDYNGEGLITISITEVIISPEIDVYYNNGNSVETITCDGTQAIQINGLSTITSTNTFTPYYNISYIDEDNQSLIESYSKDNLYLSGGLFKKTYTGNNERILTDITESPNSSFSGYLPTFEITGGIEEVSESGNIFNNFAENSVKFTLSNIPSYIQYVILLFILFFILGFIRKFRRK